MAITHYPKPRPTLARSKAEDLLNKVIQRAAAINADPAAYPYAVRRLQVFGSFLTDKDPIGDLDLAVELVPVRPAQELIAERPEWRLMHWADKTMRALQVRKPRLVSVHMHGEVRDLGVAARVVFEDDNIVHYATKKS